MTLNKNALILQLSRRISSCSYWSSYPWAKVTLSRHHLGLMLLLLHFLQSSGIFTWSAFIGQARNFWMTSWRFVNNRSLAHLRSWQRLIWLEHIRIIKLYTWGRSSLLTTLTIYSWKTIHLNIVHGMLKRRGILLYLWRQLLLNQSLNQRIITSQLLHSKIAGLISFLPIKLHFYTIWIILSHCCLAHSLMYSLIGRLLILAWICAVVFGCVSFSNKSRFSQARR